jgi:hypothetical protein
MTGNKTRPTSDSVEIFLNGIEDPDRRKECKTLASMMEEITGAKPKMWGDSIVGFGNYHYRYASGREGEWFQAGFSPRKRNLTIYIMGYLDHYADILDGLGNFTHGKGCLYVKRLQDVDQRVLKKLITASIEKQNR